MPLDPMARTGAARDHRGTQLGSSGAGAAMAQIDQVSDEDVSGAFSRGHPDALALIYERFGPLVNSIALRSLRARPDAEDVTQQVFVSAWRSRDSLDRGRGTPGGWRPRLEADGVAH